MEYTLHEEKKYKNCCGNCKFYAGRDNTDSITKSNCSCKAKYDAHRKWLKNFFPSDVSCKYFSFVPNIEYKTNDKNIISEATDLLKNYCNDRDCDSCKFKCYNRCRLRTKVENIITTLQEDKEEN